MKEKVIDFLKHFNEWRRGADTEQPHPALIGENIDTAIEMLQNSVELSQKEKTHIMELIAFAEREGFAIGDKEQFNENNYNLKKRLWYAEG